MFPYQQEKFNQIRELIKRATEAQKEVDEILDLEQTARDSIDLQRKTLGSKSKEILGEVNYERFKQHEKGYTTDHDDKHSHIEMYGLISERLASTVNFILEREGFGYLDTTRVYCIQTMALLLAWIEKIDRELEHQ